MLQRCNWRVLLLDEAPLQQALAALTPRPAFASVCCQVRRCAEARCIVSPAPGPSPGTAALLAALGGCVVGNGGSDPDDDGDDDDVEEASGLHPRAAAAAAARFPALRGHARLSSGLDGSYWLVHPEALLPGPPSKRATRSGRQVRVLAPRNA